MCCVYAYRPTRKSNIQIEDYTAYIKCKQLTLLSKDDTAIKAFIYALAANLVSHGLQEAHAVAEAFRRQAVPLSILPRQAVERYTIFLQHHTCQQSTLVRRL